MQETLIGKAAEKYEKMVDILSMVCTFKAERIYLHPDLDFFLAIDEMPKDHKGLLYMLDHNHLSVRCWNLRDKDAAKILLEDILFQFLDDDYEWNDNDWSAKSGNHTIAYGMGEPNFGFMLDLQNLYDLWENEDGARH